MAIASCGKIAAYRSPALPAWLATVATPSSLEYLLPLAFTALGPTCNLIMRCLVLPSASHRLPAASAAANGGTARCRVDRRFAGFAPGTGWVDSLRHGLGMPVPAIVAMGRC